MTEAIPAPGELETSARGAARPGLELVRSTTMPPTVVISLDLELAWGSFDLRHDAELLDMARWTHDHGVPTLLEQLTGNGLSATWAVVGILMLDRLPDVHRIARVAAPSGRDWFSYVCPSATEATAPEWFGASVVRKLKEARPEQEIGFHGFSHVTFDHPRISPERARHEVERCAALAREWGVAEPSWVFPRNRPGHLDVLRACGVRSYRGPDRHAVRLPRPLSKVWAVAADFLGARPAIVEPTLDGGLVNIPGSLMVRYAGGWRKLIPDAARLRRLRKGLRLVQERGGIFHVWLHPENLYHQRPRIERVLADFHAELGDLQAASKVRVLTMRQAARAWLGSSNPSRAPCP